MGRRLGEHETAWKGQVCYNCAIGPIKPTTAGSKQPPQAEKSEERARQMDSTNPKLKTFDKRDRSGEGELRREEKEKKINLIEKKEWKVWLVKFGLTR